MSNDDAGVGVVRALEAASLAETSAVAGQAGQASAAEELSKGDSAFKVSAFQDIESWTWMATIGIFELMGGEIAPANFVPSYLVTAENVVDFPPQAGTLTTSSGRGRPASPPPARHLPSAASMRVGGVTSINC